MTISSAEEFIRLRCSDNPVEYRRAAEEDAPFGVWEDIINQFPDMRVWVIRNKTVPIQVLRKLFTDPDPDVRCAVADKRKTPPDILLNLARDADEGVRLRVASNNKTPNSVLEILAKDSWRTVRETAQRKLLQQ